MHSSTARDNKMDLDQFSGVAIDSTPQVYSVTAKILGQDPSRCMHGLAHVSTNS